MKARKRLTRHFLFEMLDLFMDNLEGLRACRNGSPESGYTTEDGQRHASGSDGTERDIELQKKE